MVKVIREGRIVVWQGGSLWAFDVLPRDASRSNQLHAHHAIQLTMAAGGSVGIRTPDGLVEGPLILIAPDVLHAIEPLGRIALLFVEPEGRAGRTLRRRLGGAPIARLAAIPELDPVLAGLWRDPRPTDAEVAAIGMRLLVLVGGPEVDAACDRRIARVLDWLGLDATEAGVTATEAAGVACLSESRFSHLFVREVGLPFRTFLLWRRLMRAVERMAAGKSLTVAAHEAGFADSAHFSRTFRRMFGLPADWLQLMQAEE